MPVTDPSQAGEIEQPLDEAADVQEQTPEEGSADNEQQPEKKVFTLADVEAMLEDFEKRVDSRIQSQVAKSENRTNARIQQRLAALEENRAVLNLSDDEYAKAQNAIINEEQKKAFTPQGPQGKQTQQTPSEDGDVAPVQFMNTVESIFQREGVRLTKQEIEGLPEWKNPQGDPLDTLLAIKQATREKAARQKSFKETAKGRVTQGGKNSDASNISNINDSTTLYELGDKQIREKNKR